MSVRNNSPAEKVTGPKFDEQKVISVLRLQARRNLLVALAADGPKTGANLRSIGRTKGWCPGSEQAVDSTIKNLELLMDAGLVLRDEDPNDRRRSVYSLSPSVKVTREGDETIFDFDFMIVALGPDGN